MNRAERAKAKRRRREQQHEIALLIEAGAHDLVAAVARGELTPTAALTEERQRSKRGKDQH